MVIISSGILVVIFSLLAGLHVYWAVGGKWAINHVVPVTEHGNKFLNTGVGACLIVAAGLILFSAYYITAPSGVFAIIGWVIPTIFLMRAIGDFKYVGFFKNVKSSTFAELDTKFFSPLCVAIAVLGFTVEFLN